MYVWLKYISDALERNGGGVRIWGFLLFLEYLYALLCLYNRNGFILGLNPEAPLNTHIVINVCEREITLVKQVI